MNAFQENFIAGATYVAVELSVAHSLHLTLNSCLMKDYMTERKGFFAVGFLSDCDIGYDHKMRPILQRDCSMHFWLTVVERNGAMHPIRARKVFVDAKVRTTGCIDEASTKTKDYRSSGLLQKYHRDFFSPTADAIYLHQLSNKREHGNEDVQ